ncbi:uncharacterized protein LOC132914133 [Bombus pascuorum]|uniref:uncharacterized protein LOC132914133 n=1 Tax=Bombus pascuorum TaxID=65598 RepID=UPI00298E1B77|nr:uncharacterized protein LOC132914133 [Bombus pascuorum]
MCQIRVALFTTMLLAMVEISIADTISRLSLQCKNVARDAIMNSCKGERIKRSSENVQLLLRYLREGNVLHGCLYLYCVYEYKRSTNRKLISFTENVDVSQRPEDLLNFSLGSDEFEELVNEVGYRIPRSSESLSRKIFQSVAMKCCPNPKLCYDNPGIIPCMGY